MKQPIKATVTPDVFTADQWDDGPRTVILTIHGDTFKKPLPKDMPVLLIRRKKRKATKARGNREPS